jgi:predicted transposase/invertase (TIGR01784 family)
MFFAHIYFLGREIMKVSKNKTRRNYKDSVFVDLFAHDIYAKENFISLYNALHGTNLDTKTTKIQPVMLEKVLYMKYYNDIAMLVDGKIVVMIEHQSTINENMPFRFLEYIARIYEKITNPKEKFGRNLIKLPVPEFYVFYNGKEDYPTESVMKLSDAFIKLEENQFENCKFQSQIKNEKFPLEICVKVININVDKENPVLNRCEPLKEYSEFIDQVRFNIENKIPEALTTAIKQSIKQGFLADYLSRKSTEVENMLLTEYDYDTDIAVQRQEAYENGSQQKAIETAKNFLAMGFSIEQIAQGTGLSIDFIKTLKD